MILMMSIFSCPFPTVILIYNIYMLRHQQRLHRARENAFNLSQKANDVLLPSYDALTDPYLARYFDNPLLKRHLKETGVIKRKRRLSYKLGKGSP